MKTFTGENGQQTSYTYSDPNYWRVTQINNPDGGQTTYTYKTTTSPWNLETTTKINSTQNVTSEVLYDGLGRINQRQVTSDPEGTTFVDTTYDGAGYLQSTSNPYRSTLDPTYGIRSYAIDALGRVTSVSKQDSNTVTTSYSGNCSTVTDEDGKQKESCADALGRTTVVYEPDNNNILDWETDYVYDALGNLTSVTQKGGSTISTQWRTRTFSYDGLSRLTSSTTAEGGTETYSFTASGSACVGDPAQPCSDTDARGIKTTFSYDALNRLTSKTYSDGTHAANYFYDQTSYNGLTITNGKGRRTGMSDASGQTALSYDVMGRVTARRQTVTSVSPSVTKAFSFSYNADGSLNTLTYPSGRIVTYSYSNAARPLSAVDVAHSINYAQSATYWPFGQLHTLAYEKTGTSAGTTLTQTFNNRLQYSTIQASNSSQTVLNLSYGWVDANGHDNGTLLSEANNSDSTRSQSLTYDQLNRMTSWQNSSSGDSYVYDAWGNLLQKNVTKGTAETLNVTVNSDNQITNSGFTYDAAGDMTNTGDHSFTYDGEGRMTAAGTATYTYDGDSLRVQKVDTASSSNDRLYWRGYDERVLAETDTAGNAQKEFIFFAGRRIAYYSNSTASHYYFYQDPIGSVRAITNAAGSTNAYTADYYPWGLPQSMTETGIDNRYRWAGQEYDPEVLHYAFPYRNYTPQRGRFMSPDQVPGSSSAPQSWDRYSYVQNSPLNATDPLGKMMIKDGNSWDSGDGDFGGDGGDGADWSPPIDGGDGDSGAPLSDTCGDGQATVCVVSVLKNPPANDPSDPVAPAPDPQTFPTIVQQPIMVAVQPNPPIQPPQKPEPKKPQPKTPEPTKPEGPTVSRLVASEYNAYMLCVSNRTKEALADGAARATGAKLRPGDVAIAFIEGALEVEKKCAQWHPLAALDPSYPGVNPWDP